MKMRNTAVLALVAAASAPALAANITANGGFELAGAAPTDSQFWTSSGGGAAGTSSTRDSSNPFAGDWAHRLAAVGGPGQGASANVSQNSNDAFPGISLLPGSSVSMSFKGNYTFGEGGVAFYVLRILNATGAIVADTGLQTISQGTNGYQTFSTAALTVPDFGAAPNDAYFSFVEFTTAAGAFDGSTATGLVDNVVVEGTLVPAPASLGLLATGLLCAARRRRSGN
jgi:hypothetical protein